MCNEGCDMTNFGTVLQRDFSWQCYGCGKCNEKGLQAETIKTNEGYLCEWNTDTDFVAHPGKYHHGLITTICFCHGAWAATSECYLAEGKKIVDPLEYFYVNKSINYEVLQPIPLQTTVDILAQVKLQSDYLIADVEFKIQRGNNFYATARTNLFRVHADQMKF